ncbi:hypothetical protein [Paenibacillus glycinis]|uniref:Uncharacterized protein n=1 Tax=Paenibacillus glycinis TaxID=2697035 RepID=A0ABW9XPY7_9BACL|nr:hypothetical protein [Paenibacillus glycinis]NBD24706.1 hypothetical protein [Paenibacillus glycinis]
MGKAMHGLLYDQELPIASRAVSRADGPIRPGWLGPHPADRLKGASIWIGLVNRGKLISYLAVIALIIAMIAASALLYHDELHGRAFPLLPFVFPSDSAAMLPLSALIASVFLFGSVWAYKKLEMKPNGRRTEAQLKQVIARHKEAASNSSNGFEAVLLALVPGSA